jgi:hypothetical protein
MSDSAALQALLERRFLSRNLDKLALNDSSLLERLSRTRQALAPPRGRHAPPRLAHGVLAFRIQGRNTPYPDLKYACYGIDDDRLIDELLHTVATRPTCPAALSTDWEGRRLLDDRPPADDRDELLHTVANLRLSHPTQFAACCRALQYAWHTNIAPDDVAANHRPRPKNQKIANFLLRHTQPDRARQRHFAV